MTQELPYLIIDDDFSLNYTLVALILYKLGRSPKNKAVLDFEKLQVFLYLLKNPSKINMMLSLAGKKKVYVDKKYTFTIESLSSNVDILFKREKLELLIKELAARGMLACEMESSQGPLKYLLNEKGCDFAESLFNNYGKNTGESTGSNVAPTSENYFEDILELISSLSTLQSQSNSKMNKHLNAIFKGD
ncbi:hypothetical protein L0636_09000 [Halomonas janggokensis]|uniref:Uncharacterized protein n=1 Tax=Vreelandella janggokensis TaxID=370767 RepID=A0ABT4IWB6_9GAMM|nr:ABC-three component system middle component 4 [Halomonas janggokensis]MCZ0927977.1 hypothetical protein [Halomonas janggokensis]MCZ0930565.1 hypothetical protein [Halomonas janggokensis]